MASLVALLTAAGCAMGGDEYEHAGELAALEGGKADGPPAPHKAWTFVLYGAADNNLADSIRDDINELESVGSTAQVNLLAFLDRPEGAYVAYLLKDADPVNVVSPATSWGQVDSGDASTLIDVVSWAHDRFPADHVALVISGHGGATPRVIAPDFSTGHAIGTRDLERAIFSIAARRQAPIDIFGADACLMQTVELAYQLRDQTDFVVGSENTEPGTGWNYKAIGTALAQGTATEPTPASSLAEVMVGSYARDYGGSEASVSLSALDTTALDEATAETLYDLGGAIAQLAVDGGRAELQAIARDVRRVEGDDTEFADALDLMRRLQESSSSELRAAARAAELRLTTADSVAGTPPLIHVAWGGGGNGASIYFPTSNESLFQYEARTSFAYNGWSGAIRSIWWEP